MKNLPFDIHQLIQNGKIHGELDYNLAMVADRKLRLLAKEDQSFHTIRAQLRDLIAAYEKEEWADASKINDKKTKESDASLQFAESERLFYEVRKTAIRKKLKDRKLTQENLAQLLGHKSKTHMSELMNGLKPFTLRDLVVIHFVLRIKMDVLIPVFLSADEQERINGMMKEMVK